ncbi:hypothetical protein KJ693_12055 [bacterium]|nr:hypothetical protein [bacterium]MBU1616026.1 hypothetical protein [bacterium]
MGDAERAKHHFKECIRFIPDHKKARENLEKISDRELRTAD